jgi:FtsP/CotA-like multicopper oxidase with cupredoxin domain
MQSLLALDAVEKHDDLDGDGDPDVIRIRLELMELNGKSPDHAGVVPKFEIAPGVTPGLWVFAPKTRGMTTANFETTEVNRMIRLPSPVIRVEQGDTVHLTLENGHYLPHTIHFHGADHPFKTPAGEGNDGVPIFSEHPTMPGKARTYWLQSRQPGTTFYHCHVQPHTHILMGLQGMLVVEENRPNNWVQTFNIGAGRVRAPSVAVKDGFQREYDLHYLEIDRELNNRIQEFTDARLVSRSIHRGYNIVQRAAEYYVLNGRSFPYTLRESLVVTTAGEKARLRVLNGGGEGLSLHFHGHKPTLTHRDGVALDDAQREQRDVFWLSSAQRADFSLDTTDNGLDAYGAGAWLLHDHRERAVTTDGMGPGGDVSLVVYEDYLDSSGLPKTVGGLQSLAPFFSADYYARKLPVFAGMGGHDLGQPGAATQRPTYRHLLFWVSCALIVVFSALLWRSGRRA